MSLGRSFNFTLGAFLFIQIGLSPSAVQANDPCDPNAMTQAIQACGMDFNCINQVNSEFMANCLGEQPAQPQPQPAQPAGTGISDSEMQQRIDACGMNIGCLNQLMQELQSNMPQPVPPPVPPSQPGEGGTEFTLPDPEDTTQRIHEQTVLPASWLQTYQNALVNCEDDNRCWEREVMQGVAYPQSFCRHDL